MDSPLPTGAAAEAPALDRADRWLDRIETVFNVIAGFFIWALILLAAWQVFARKFFNAPILGYIDITELAMATFAFLGIAYCQRRGGHVRMEIVLARLKGRALWAAEIFATLVAMVLIAVIVWYSFEHAWRAWEFGDSTIDIELPIWPAKLVVPVAFTLLLARLALQLWGYWRLFRRPDASPVAVPVVETPEDAARQEIDAAAGGDGRGA